MHIYTDNKSGVKRNEPVLDDFPGDLDATEANNKILDNCDYPLATIQAIQNKKQKIDELYQTCLR